LNPATPWICLHGKSCLKLGDVVGNNLEKDFGLGLSFMTIFLVQKINVGSKRATNFKNTTKFKKGYKICFFVVVYFVFPDLQEETNTKNDSIKKMFW
jgi:hypothetical protein